MNSSRVSGALSRRSFLGLFSSAVLTTRLLADTRCQMVPGGEFCVSQVDFAQFAQDAFQPQQMPEWCWAACISMVFAFYGHAVSQARIVSEVYGAPVNMPAGYGITVARQLNRVWKDDNGSRFRSVLTAAYDADAGVDTLNNAMLISELDGDHPIVIGAGSHAMVLTMMQYAVTQFGPNVRRCGVFDPWPGKGARDLTVPEMVPLRQGGAFRFAATVRVQDLEN